MTHTASVDDAMEQKDLLAQYKRIIEINQELGTTYDHVSLLRKAPVLIASCGYFFRLLKSDTATDPSA